MTPASAYEPGLSFRRYREIGQDLPILTVNASLLKEPTPLHSKYAMEGKDGTSDALSLGDAVHKAILEPDAFEQNFDDFYLLWTDTKGLDTKKAVEARILHPDKILLNQEMVDQVRYMRDAVHRHKLAAWLLSQCKERELSGVAPDKDLGIVRKIRVDACNGIGIPGESWSDYLVDLKSTRNVPDFGREIRKFEYDLQAAYYLDADGMITGKPRQGFLFIAVANTPPYCARVYTLLPDALEKARIIYKRRLAALAVAYLERSWDAYENESEPIPVG